jgi:hypothetical protein
MKKFLLLIALCILLFETVQPVLAQTELVPDEVPQAASSEKCWGWWAFTFCVKSIFNQANVRTGIKVSYLPYVYLDIVKNGCFNTNPTRLLANLKYCVTDFVKPTKANGYKSSFKLQVEACMGVWKFKTCKKSSVFSFYT